MNKRNLLSALLAAIMLTLVIPIQALAAPVEITATMKSSLDKTITNTTGDAADRIRSLYSEFLTLQNQEKDLDAKIKAVHSENSKTSSVLSKQIGQIDKAKIDELKAQVTLRKEQYKPLFTEYTELNKQIKAARALKDKDLTSLLRLQADLLKWPIQLARADIKVKEEEWSAARSKAAAVMKELRAMKADADPIKVQIKAKQETIKSIETDVTPEWNAFKAAVKQGDSTNVLTSLASLVSSSRQIIAVKQDVFQLETNIHDIFAAATAQLP